MLFDLSEALQYQIALRRSFGHVAEIINDLTRTGVYCAIAKDSGTVLVTFNVAYPLFINAERYYHLAGEKAFRLGRNYKHLTSGQSANEKAQQYPGAFRTAPWGEPDSKIVSISGLPTGSADLAVGLLGCYYLDIISLDYADLIAKQDEENPWWDELKKKHII